jgi:hypothetical protein
MTKITNGDAADIEWALGPGACSFQRSTFGEMLERAELFAFDERGVRVDFKYDTWQTTYIRKPTGEPSYTPEFEVLGRFARVSRIMRRMERDSAFLTTALCEYHGDLGARWAGTEMGRMASIYPLTTDGEKYLNRDFREHPPGIDGSGPTPSERICNDMHAQKLAPNDLRRKRHSLMRTEAHLIMVESWKLWEQARLAIEGPVPARRIGKR